MKRPNLFSYDDYRKYLGDWYLWMKETKGGFSYRAFSNWAGFKSPNQLLLVIHGQRNIPLPSMGRYVDVLKLKESERRYFEILVKFNQAKDMSAKKEYFKELSVYWLRRGSYLEKSQQQYLANWYTPAVRELVNLKDFRESGVWISQKLGGLVTPAQAKKAVAILLELNLLKRDSSGRLVQTFHYVTTGNEVESVAAFLYHEQMMKLALDSLRGRPSTERNITALTFTMRKADYPTLVADINDFRKRIISLLQNRASQGPPAKGGEASDDDLYQLNVHLFPVSKL